MSKNKPPKDRKASPSPVDPHDHETREAQDDPHRLARIYLRGSFARAKGHWALAFWRDEWWVWEGQRYRRLADAEITAQVTAAIKQEFDRWLARGGKRSAADKRAYIVAKVTRGRVSNTLQALKSLVFVRTDVEQPTWIRDARGRRSVIALANGLLDLDALLVNDGEALVLHSADWFSPVCLPYSYDSSALCPRFVAFVNEILEGDSERIDLLQEWFGLSLMSDTSFQKFLIVVGEGANGKTVLLSVLTQLLGDDNVSHVPLELFGQRFQLVPSVGKLANIVSEVGDCDRVDEAILKSFVSGEPVHIDRKNLPAIQAPATARLILATNNLPPFADRSSGLWRRLTILPFRVAVPIDRQDRHLKDKLLEELPGIFNWSIAGWRRLLERRQFTEPALCRQVLDDYRVETNPARAFLQDEMRFCGVVSVPCHEAYLRYEAWCEARGFKHLNDRQFGKEVMREYRGVRRERARGGRQAARPWVYMGLAWTDAVPPSPQAPVSRRLRPRPSNNETSTVSHVS